MAKIGETPQIFTKDEVEGLMRTDGTPLAPSTSTRTVAMGDVVRDPNTQAPAAPPSLRKDGEALPQDSHQGAPGAMRPVQFPKQKPDDQPDATDLPRDPKPAADADAAAKPDANAPACGIKARGRAARPRPAASADPRRISAGLSLDVNWRERVQLPQTPREQR